MIACTDICIPQSLLTDCIKYSVVPGKTTINKPTGRFFYDPWIIKEEYKGSCWDNVLSYIPTPHGEARLVLLESGTSYFQHADIDDRWHLNLTGDSAFFINVDECKLYPISADGRVYEINAGIIHSAVSIGYISRMQLVVRKLLPDITLRKPVQVECKLTDKYSRYEFDNVMSPLLNKLAKTRKLSSFNTTDNNTATFYIEQDAIAELQHATMATVDIKIDNK